MKIGIVGLPNAGKSTLFNALTSSAAAAENYPFCYGRAQPRPGADCRRAPAAGWPRHRNRPKWWRRPSSLSISPASSPAPQRGEGLGNRFLAHIRETDAIAMVARCFVDSQVSHVVGTVDPVRDLDILMTELLLADLQTVEKARAKVAPKVRSGSAEAKAAEEFYRPPATGPRPGACRRAPWHWTTKPGPFSKGFSC